MTSCAITESKPVLRPLINGRATACRLTLVCRVVLVALLLESVLWGASPASLTPALESITSQDLLRHIQRLSSDEFEGRAPGTRGEDLTVRYLIEQFKGLGLEPGNPDGS